MLKLNEIEEDDLQYYITDNPIGIANWSPVLDDPNEPLEEKKEAAFNLTSFYIELAYANYALENTSEVKPNFEKAAPFAFLRGFDPQLKTVHNDWTIQEDLNVVLLFGQAQLLSKLATTPIKLYAIGHQAKLQYVELLKSIGTGHTPETSDINIAIAEAKNTKDKDVQQYILPLIEAILALASGENTLWQTSIDKAIKWHADECKFGDYKDMEEGFICLNALTMAKLGKEMHGWSCSTDSLYLPLFLID